MNKPTIVIDKNIPFIHNVLDNVANVQYLAAKDMTPVNIRYADALIVRTRTRCNADLLRGSNVKFIATATIGFDHIDQKYCAKNNIAWINATGCNADSVAQYMGSALCFWSEQKQICLHEQTIGIVGVGHVGKAVKLMAQRLGMRVLLNDPPLAAIEGDEKFVDLQTIAHEADVITFHTPLTYDGVFSTHYLADECFFDALKKQPLIINTARGGIVNETALKKALEAGLVSDCIIDCWENEPGIDRELLQKAIIATPHIAGYSADGKAVATEMSVHAVSRFFNLGLEKFKTGLLPKEKISQENLQKKLLQIYPIYVDSQRLKCSIETFEKQRSEYPIRREADIV